MMRIVTTTILLAAALLRTGIADEDAKTADPKTTDANLPAPEARTLATRVIKGLEKHSAISIAYYRAKQSEAPVLILLHDLEDSQERWARTGIPQSLQSHGYCVITAELRHFELDAPIAIKNKLARQIAINDLDAVKRFALERHHEHELNIRKTGFLAVGRAASMAALWSNHDWHKRPIQGAPSAVPDTPRGQDVQAMCFVSPEVYPRIQLIPQTVVLKPFDVAFQLATGNNEPDERLVQGLTRAMSNRRNKEKTDARVVESSRAGIELLLVNDRKLQIAVMAFFDVHVKERKFAWLCRKNPLLQRNPCGKQPGQQNDVPVIANRSNPPTSSPGTESAQTDDGDLQGVGALRAR